MLQGPVIVLASFAYLGLLFAVAWYADQRAASGRSIINPYIYSLSLAVYCTSWTYYGSVGRAASDGIGFLPIYLGPTLMAAIWWVLLLKMLRISKANRITSLADFVASRYGKSHLLGGLVTVIAVVGVIPYIALQLKAVSSSLSIVLRYPNIAMPANPSTLPVLGDNTFYIALILAAFAILFGARHLDATERHEGMVAAIAFESVIKLVAFTAVGVFVTFGMYDGFGDVFHRAAQLPAVSPLLTFDAHTGDYGSWAALTFLSMLAIMFLPRQFQIGVVENVNESHLKKAIWLFPLYLLAINIFVLPIAFGGLMHFPAGSVDADTFVLTLPMSQRQEGLTLLVFIGGLSAATAMVIVETIALSIMVCNDLVMPVLLRMKSLRLNQRKDLSGLLLTIRRGAILLVLFLGYLYYRLAGEAYALVSIGLISFAAVAQFAPAVIGGMFWRGGTRNGAFVGLLGGFAVWVYTLLLPSFAKSAWLPISFIEDGLFGIALLKPLELFGLSGLDQIPHSLFWSMLVNVGGYIGISLLQQPNAVERSQAMLFVDAHKQPGQHGAGARFWRGSASIGDLQSLVARFMGPERSRKAFSDYAARRGAAVDTLEADAELVHYAETLLTGAIGSASARVVVASVVQEEPLGIDEVMNILNETSQVIAHSKQLEQKSRELEAATRDLTAANARLKELDRLKDDFVSTVTHELRTPLTSIRAFSEILNDNPDITDADRNKFLGIIVKESERLTRLINQVLYLAKIESGKTEWQNAKLDLREIIEDAATVTSQLFKDKNVRIKMRLDKQAPLLVADGDGLMQVLLNLLSNAAKFCDPAAGRVEIALYTEADTLRVDVTDNGHGISAADQKVIFDKFRQVTDAPTGKPQGTGLGLHISRQIIAHFGGKLWVNSSPGKGATFSFSLPLSLAAPAQQPRLKMVGK